MVFNDGSIAEYQVDLLEANQIRPFDLAVVNLYPFEQTIANPDVTTAQAIELAYQSVNRIHFEGIYYRRDIGHRVREK